MNNALMVGIGGFLGACSRYMSGKVINKYWKRSFPLATFLINIVGSFVLGLVIAHPEAIKNFGNELKYGVGIGFLGAFTTFSTFEYEALQLLEHKKTYVAMLYIGLSIVVGFILAWLAVFYM